MANAKLRRMKASNTASAQSIVGLAEMLPKEILETIVVEALMRHRFLRDVAEIRLSESCDELPGANAVGAVRIAYIKAMIDCHAQQACLSALLDVLGYVPEMKARQK